MNYCQGFGIKLYNHTFSICKRSIVGCHAGLETKAVLPAAAVEALKYCINQHVMFGTGLFYRIQSLWDMPIFQSTFQTAIICNNSHFNDPFMHQNKQSQQCFTS